MQTANQIFFALLAFILFGLYISTVTPAGFKKEPNMIYWQGSILLRAMAFILWVLAPYTFGFVLTMANFCFLASMVLLLILFRSWRVSITRSNLRLAVFFLILFIGLYEILRQANANFSVRTGFMSIPIAILSLLEINELRKLIKSDQTLGLKILLGMVLISLTFTLSVTLYGFFLKVEPGIQLVQFGNTLMLWMGISMHLLIYIAVSSYLYQRLMFRERDALKNIERTSKENTQIRGLLEEREELIASLLKANKTAATGALSASIAHELNQPVGAISLNTEFIQMKLAANQMKPEEFKEVVDSIQTDNQRIAKIVSTLRNIFKQDDVNLSYLNLDEVIEQIKPVVLPQARQLNIQLNFDLNAHQAVLINKSEISQVLINLLNNSIDALSTSAIERKQINIQTQLLNDYVELKVSDNGPGIPIHLRSTIFDLMTTNKKQGMGLGLWLCKHIIDRHQAVITHRRSISGGAEFVIQFPLNTTPKSSANN